MLAEACPRRSGREVISTVKPSTGTHHRMHRSNWSRMALKLGIVVAAASVAISLAQNVTITVMTSSGHQQYNPVWDMLPQFQAQTGIKVQLDKVGTLSIESKFLQDARLGTCSYDAVEMLDGGTAGAAPYMTNLEPYITSSGTTLADFESGFVPWSVKAVIYNGQLDYYPFYSGAKAIAYRKDLFNDPKNQAAFKQQYGYDLPTPPTTPQQLLDVARFFTRDGMYGIVFSGQGDNAETTMGDLAFRSGIDGYTDANNNALWGPDHPDNQQKVAQAAQWLQDLIYKYHVAPTDVTGMGTGDTVAFYDSGKAAMLYDTFYLAWTQMIAPNVVSVIGQTGTFEPPSFQSGAGGIPFWWAFGIPKCSQHKDAAWKFLQWFMSQDNLKLDLTKGIGTFVPTNTALLTWAVANNVLPAGTAEAVRHAQAYTITKVTEQLRSTVNLPLVEQLLADKLSGAQYAKESGDQIQQFLQQAGIAGK